jgi:2'-5' RNA ligase
MALAVVGYFNKYIDEQIRLLWTGMEEIGVDNYLIHSENNPHFKFVIYEVLNVNKTEQVLCLIAKTIEKIPIQFKTFSFYPNEKPFVCIDIAVTHLILNLHAEIRSKCDQFGKLYDNNYFDQGLWKPDCQLTIGFEKEKLNNSIDFLSNMKLPINGIIERIGLIEFHPAKQLFSFELK